MHILHRTCIVTFVCRKFIFLYKRQLKQDKKKLKKIVSIYGNTYNKTMNYEKLGPRTVS